MRALILFLSVSLFLVGCGSTNADTEPRVSVPLMQELMAEIRTTTQLPIPESTPHVAFVSQDFLQAMFDVSEAVFIVVAAYESDPGIIYLHEDWDRANIRHMSSLVHELTHHMQFAADLEYECRGAVERVAYLAQQHYLESRGFDFIETTGMEPWFLVQATTCPQPAPM